MNSELSAILKRYNMDRANLNDHECDCGNEFLCRGRKLAKMRNVDEDRQIEQFAKCIPDAAAMPENFFSTMSCYYFGDTSWGER